MYSRWKIALILVVSCSSMSYANVVSVPVEKYRYVWHISPLIPQVVLTHLTLRGQHCIYYENVFTSRGRGPRDILRSPHPRCVVMASRMTNIQPLSHDRGCPQASLVLREWVWDSYHLTGGYLPSNLYVGAPLYNSKLWRVNVENKSHLACHLLRLLSSLYGYISVSSSIYGYISVSSSI
jgi:hypothetical protein